MCQQDSLCRAPLPGVNGWRDRAPCRYDGQTMSLREPPAHLGLGPSVRVADLPDADGPDGAGPEARERLLRELREGRPHEDLRDWLRNVDAIGELRVLEGVDREESIGRITEMLQHTDGAPAVLFDRIPGYEPGRRVLVNAQSERRRLAVTLGLPYDIGTWDLIERWEQALDRGEPLPAVVLVGMDPLLFVASALEMAPGLSELEWVGGMRGRPVECVAGRHTGLPIPARAEIALEGVLRPDVRHPEGPFGEWTGYYASGTREEPVFEVRAVYHRDDPIVLGVPPQKPPYEAHRFRQYLRSANLRREVRLAGVPDVVAAWCHGVGGCRLFNVVAIKQRYPGHARQAGHVAAQCRTGAYLGRITVVVDEDIDVSDLDEVVWAICTRSDPERSFDIIRRAWSGPLDPAIPPAAKGFNSRVIIDATRPLEWRDEFPAPIGPSPEEKRRTREQWGWILDA